MSRKWRVVPKIASSGLTFIIQLQENSARDQTVEKWSSSVTNDTFTTAQSAIDEGVKLFGSLSHQVEWLPQ